MQSHTVDLDGPVHYVDHGGSGRPIVLVHGLGGSHVNWMAVAPALTAHGRVLALDLVGHGRTRSHGRSAAVSDNQRVVGHFIEQVAGGPAVLMGNSMGGFLSLWTAAIHPERVAALVLVDPAQPVTPPFDARALSTIAAMAVPLVGEALIKRRYSRPPAEVVGDLMRLCCVDVGRVAPAVMAAQVAMAEERRAWSDEAGRDFLAAARTLTAALLARSRYRSLVHRVTAPTLLVQGAQDRLVSLASSQAMALARPDWRFEVLDDVGHVPQLEAPERFLALVEPWLASRSPAARL